MMQREREEIMKSKAKTFAKTGIDFIRSYQSLAVMAVYAVFYLAAIFLLRTEEYLISCD